MRYVSRAVAVFLTLSISTSAHASDPPALDPLPLHPQPLDPLPLDPQPFDALVVGPVTVRTQSTLLTRLRDRSRRL